MDMHISKILKFILTLDQEFLVYFKLTLWLQANPILELELTNHQPTLSPYLPLRLPCSFLQSPC